MEEPIENYDQKKFIYRAPNRRSLTCGCVEEEVISRGGYYVYETTVKCGVHANQTNQ